MPSIANATSSDPHLALATIGKGEGDGVGLILLRNNLRPHKLTNIGWGMGIEMGSFGPFVFNGLEGPKPPPGTRHVWQYFWRCQSLKANTQHHSQSTFCGMQSSLTPIKNGPTKGARSVRVPKARGVLRTPTARNEPIKVALGAQPSVWSFPPREVRPGAPFPSPEVELRRAAL